jgi:hypothetical protein
MFDFNIGEQQIHENHSGCDQWLVLFRDGGSVVVNAQGRIVGCWPHSTST